jgi:hypothetical protein
MAIFTKALKKCGDLIVRMFGQNLPVSKEMYQKLADRPMSK